jgi:replication-associated recombination protein RarA
MISTAMDWGIKYRPRRLEDVLMTSWLKRSLSKVVQQKGGISLLFWGRPGCGKTTVAKLINPENTVFINCSTNNSIDTIRWIESEFVSGVVTGDRRLLLLDEADNLTTEAQAAIRAVSEELAIHNDFILTANDPNKLSEAVRSRFLPLKFDLEKSDDLTLELKTLLRRISQLEGLSLPNEKSLEEIVEKTFPDVRRMIKTLQIEMN